MMETGRVLSMLNLQASRQMRNDNLDAAKRSVNEAIRYYQHDGARRSSHRHRHHRRHEAEMLRCQAQVAALLKLKIGRLQAALGEQKRDDELLASGRRIIAQSSRTLRGMLPSTEKPPHQAPFPLLDKKEAKEEAGHSSDLASGKQEASSLIPSEKMSSPDKPTTFLSNEEATSLRDEEEKQQTSPPSSPPAALPPSASCLGEATPPARRRVPEAASSHGAAAAGHRAR